MKKIVSIIIAVVTCAFVFTACNSNKSIETNKMVKSLDSFMSTHPDLLNNDVVFQKAIVEFNDYVHTTLSENNDIINDIPFELKRVFEYQNKYWAEFEVYNKPYDGNVSDYYVNMTIKCQIDNDLTTKLIQGKIYSLKGKYNCRWVSDYEVVEPSAIFFDGAKKYGNKHNLLTIYLGAFYYEITSITEI